MAVPASTPFARAFTNNTPESSIESWLISETALESYLGERLTRVQQTALYLLNTLLQEPAVWWLPERPSKCACEVGD
jgi:hypothetical protein